MSELLPPYKITPPSIPSGLIYCFTTDYNMNYEVRFGRKEKDILSATIVFGVTNDEFEGEEYVATNKGDVYRVMSTIVEIVRTYKAKHPNIHSLEFTGEPAKNENTEEQTKRLKLYKRYIKYVFDDSWKIVSDKNRVIISKKAA